MYKPPTEMTENEINQAIDELQIVIKSHEGDGLYDTSEAQNELDELENALANGDFLDFERYE